MGSHFLHTVTSHDMRVLCHFEGVAEPAKMLCMFLRDEDNTYAYVLFYFWVTNKETSAPTLAIYEDISRMDRTKDLRNHVEKTVLVKKADVVVAADEAKNYTKVECIEPCVGRALNSPWRCIPTLWVHFRRVPLENGVLIYCDPG